MGSLGAFIAALPKAELHVHLVGSASLPTVLELGRRHPGQGVPASEDKLRESYQFREDSAKDALLAEIATVLAAHLPGLDEEARHA